MWIPFAHIASLEMQQPKRLRDLLWAPVIVRTGPSFKGVELGEVLVPAISPFSFRHSDDAVRLGRATVWDDQSGEDVPFGQKCFLVDGEDSQSWSCGVWRSRDPKKPRKAMPLRNDLLNPISPEHPAGINLRYDPLYDKIKEARREDADTPQGEWQRERKLADWVLVIKLINDALATKTKDLQLAAWLAEALLRREGLTGLRDVLDLSRGFIENFWTDSIPKSKTTIWRCVRHPSSGWVTNLTCRKNGAHHQGWIELGSIR